jgi:hypothetical protein
VADGRLACLADASQALRRERAVKLASEPGYLDSCKPVPVPAMPGRLMSVEPEWLAEMRAKNHDEDGIVAAYSAWECEKAGAIAENESRLRGLLWCHRQLRADYAELRDEALKRIGRHVRDFIATHWGIDEPPATYSDAYKLAMRRVAEMMTT